MADYALNTDSEEWRDIPDWDGYQASSLGRIRSLDRVKHQRFKGTMSSMIYRGCIRAQSMCSQTKYMKVGLSNLQNNGKRRTMPVHLLVCMAFHGERPFKHDVAHNNGNRQDNRAINLRWATRKSNAADKIKHGTLNSGERNGMAKISDAQFDEILKLRADGIPVRELAGRFNVWPTSLHDKIRKHRRLNEGL